MKHKTESASPGELAGPTVAATVQSGGKGLRQSFLGETRSESRATTFREAKDSCGEHDRGGLWEANPKAICDRRATKCSPKKIKQARLIRLKCCGRSDRLHRQAKRKSSRFYPDENHCSRSVYSCAGYIPRSVTNRLRSKQRGDPAGSPLSLSCPCCCTNSPSHLGACHNEPNRLRPQRSGDPAYSLNGLRPKRNDRGRRVPIFPVPLRDLFGHSGSELRGDQKTPVIPQIPHFRSNPSARSADSPVRRLSPFHRILNVTVSLCHKVASAQNTFQTRRNTRKNTRRNTLKLPKNTQNTKKNTFFFFEPRNVNSRSGLISSPVARAARTEDTDEGELSFLSRKPPFDIHFMPVCRPLSENIAFEKKLRTKLRLN